VSDATRRVGLVAAVIVTLLGVAVAVSLETTGPRPSVAPFASPSRPVASAPPESSIRGYRDFSVLPGAPAEPFGKALQSRLWTIDGRWWAALVQPTTRETRIYALSADQSTWTDTGVLIDERVGAVSDALWQDGHLYVATTVPDHATASGGRLRRFSLGKDGRFAPDPNFPVRINDGGLTSISIARDSTGRLWAAFVRDTEVQLAHSTVDDAVWSAPERLPIQSGPIGPDDLAALVSLDSGRLGIVWTDRTKQTISFASRADADAPERWSVPETALDGVPLSDDAISVAAAPGGRVAVAVETAVADAPNPGVGSAQTVTLVRDGDGTWRRTLLSRVQDHLGTPTVLVDATTGRLHVFASSPRHGGAIYLKSTDIERLEFPVGRGTLVLSDASNPTIAVPTSTKGPVDLAADFVVLAFDRGTGTYWHAVVGPSDVAAGPSQSPSTSQSSGPSQSPGPSQSAAPSPSAPPTAVPAPALYINDNFDPWPLNQPIRNGWEMRSGDPPNALNAAADATGTGRHARLRTSTIAAVRACKSFTPVATGTVVVKLRIQLESISTTDNVITSLTDRGNQAVSVRFGQGGTFAYYAGPTKVRSTVPFRIKTWYRSVVTVHPSQGTYDWVMATDRGAVILRVQRVPFRDAIAKQVSSLCLQTSEGKPALALSFDDVVVSR